jgi:hypothetical protein
MNSKLGKTILDVINPTLNYQVENILALPIHLALQEKMPSLSRIVEELIIYCRKDWDARELSWDFESLLLLEQTRCRDSLASIYTNLRNYWQSAILKVQRLEKKSNSIFIETYGLEDELSPEVPLSEITLTCNPHYRYGSSRLKSRNWAALCDRFPETCQQLDAISAEMAPELPEEERLGLEQRLLEDTMKEFISYAVGCMFGRYSLDKPGLILANQGETLDDYLRQVPDPAFMPDADNVIPMLDGDWFPDDVSERFKRFLRVAFGAAHYEENLAFIEAAIGRDVRSYFLRDFYDDHVKTYKKRPIYWLFSSPGGSFNALVYMHRYRADTVSVALNDYLREFRAKLAARQRHLEHVERSAETPPRDKTQAVKEIVKIAKILAELQDYEDQTLYPLAIQQIEIDLDDGVLVNYKKLGPALARVAGLSE